MINVFGQAGSSCVKILEVVQFKVKHRFEDKFVSAEALVYSVICCDVKGQLIPISQKEYSDIS